ncbi:ArsR/SmtB family transcription factor [Saccharomonospora glauca]|jgi:DNA-binding transcriptional ArsR family regulator|uniref:Putative transcriptional regulator n=1 Tax=Saccharomonospora glauca K62 TaxID=928724 RepID=I1D224_9PSEU|nr:winged helix-turn-helix domain-containing protein [Saccharomonospora glauca]EIE98998.1 putative transcriptional regulator [Saccharomonospora glauca K62]
MVVDGLGDTEANRLFHGLADATRRDIVATVLQREQSISSLARRYDMSFAAVQKHVAVLERAALVVKQRRGREQLVRGNLDALRKAARLLDTYEELWRHRVRAIDDLVSEDDT